jgi:hypothetical protein
MKRNPQPKGPRAAQLRQRKFRRLEGLEIPIEGLPGSLSLNTTRCGKPNCHCATGEGHPSWLLTYSVRGQKRVLRIPAAMVAEVRRRVEQGRAFTEAVDEVFAANAGLLALGRPRRRARGR